MTQDYTVTVTIPFKASSMDEAHVEADGIVDSIREVVGAVIDEGVVCTGGQEEE